MGGPPSFLVEAATTRWFRQLVTRSTSTAEGYGACGEQRPPPALGDRGRGPTTAVPCLRDRALSNAERPDELPQPASSSASASPGETFEDAISAPGLDVTLAKGEGSPPRAGRNEGGRQILCGCCDRLSEKASVCQGVVAADAQEEPPGRSPIGGAVIIAHPDAGRNSPFLASFAANLASVGSPRSTRARRTNRRRVDELSFPLRRLHPQLRGLKRAHNVSNSTVPKPAGRTILSNSQSSE